MCVCAYLCAEVRGYLSLCVTVWVPWLLSAVVRFCSVSSAFVLLLRPSMLQRVCQDALPVLVLGLVALPITGTRLKTHIDACP